MGRATNVAQVVHGLCNDRHRCRSVAESPYDGGDRTAVPQGYVSHYTPLRAHILTQNVCSKGEEKRLGVWAA
jgi:hypothetical protein